MRITSWTLVAILAVTAAACASRSDVEALKKEVEALKATQAQLVKRVGGVQAAPQEKPLPASIDLSGGPFKGSATADVALVEFSDYECPFCIRHFTQVMPQVEAAYIQTGKIRYAFRDFPIDQLHPESIRAHVASHCANEQGKFWDLHNRLFSKAGTHTPADLAARAKEAGLNAGAFASCVADDKYSASIRQSTAFAISLGASGTPFFMVGKIDPKTNQFRPLTKLPGALPYAQFQQAIDAALSQK
jgi:protein-disulfide isomerase